MPCRSPRSPSAGLAASLREKKRELKKAANKVNECKAQIDELTRKVQAKKREEEDNGVPSPCGAVRRTPGPGKSHLAAAADSSPQPQPQHTHEPPLPRVSARANGHA